MDDKEKRKVGDALFEKYITKCQSVIDKAKPSVRSASKDAREQEKSMREAILAGLNGHYVDFEEALAKGQTNIDPQTYSRATDGRSEKPGKQKPYIRDINERIEQAKRQVEEDKRAGIDTDHSYHDEKIAEKEQLIRDTMDRRGTNTISTKAFGYDVSLVRVGERGEFSIGKNGQPLFFEYNDTYEREDGTTVAGTAKAAPANLTVNGKPVTVKPSLTGDAVSFEGKYPEISQDLAREGIEKMAEDGITKWSKEVGERDARHTVELAMKGSAGRMQVAVDKNLKGDQVARTGGPRVSADTWKEAGENMLAGEGGKRSFEKVLADGTAVEFRMGARIDGRGAVIEENFGGREVREERDRVIVGKEIFEDATREMLDNQSITAKAADLDGNDIEFKRPGKIRMFVNGQEMNNYQYQEALAEVAGVNDGKEFTTFANLASEAKDQVGIQFVRTGTGAAMAAPIRAFKEGGQKNANLLSQLLSMLFSTVSRSTQSLGR